MSNLGNILIVDDSKDLLEAFQHFLTLAGYTVNSVNTSRLLEEIINKFKPDVILLDVLMPGMGGREVCKKLKSNLETKNVPIILMSANPYFLLDYAECLADETIEKPFNITDVVTKIKAVIKTKEPQG